MPWFLRTVKAPKWFQLPAWVPSGQVDAEKLWDLKSPHDDNTISVWHLSDQSEIASVAVAVGSNRHNLEDLNYILIDEAELVETGVTIKSVEGKTPCKKVRGLHRNIVEISSSQLCALALKFYEKGSKDGFDRHEITELLTTAYGDGELDDSLNDKIKQKILDVLKGKK